MKGIMSVISVKWTIFLMQKHRYVSLSILTVKSSPIKISVCSASKYQHYHRFGYYMNKNTNLCMELPSFCVTADNIGNCEECIDGFALLTTY